MSRPCGDVVKILSDGRYQSGPSHQLLPPLCGPSLEPPDPFDEHRNEKAVTRRMTEVKTQVNALLDAGWEVYTADEARPEHEAWTRRMQPPKGGSAPGRSVDRKKTSQSFFGALSPTSKKVKLYPIEGNQNTEQTILALERLQRETEAGKIVVVLDDARFHHARALTGLHEPGRLLERITPIHLPPYAPDHNPAGHVRNTAKSNIANIQRETPEETFGAFVSHVTGRTVDHGFEHLPLRETRNDFVS
ncbi:transposase [Propionibacterium acidifaciens]